MKKIFSILAFLLVSAAALAAVPCCDGVDCCGETVMPCCE
jgi:hypothetical protein